MSGLISSWLSRFASVPLPQTEPIGGDDALSHARINDAESAFDVVAATLIPADRELRDERYYPRETALNNSQTAPSSPRTATEPIPSTSNRHTDPRHTSRGAQSSSPEAANAAHDTVGYATVVDDEFLSGRPLSGTSSDGDATSQRTEDQAESAVDPATSRAISGPGGGRVATQFLDVPSTSTMNMEGRSVPVGSLPEDDGMSLLRKRIHEIREMAASSEEKARRLHALMTESYLATHPQLARAQSPTSIISGDRPFTPVSPRSLGEHESLQLPHSPESMLEPVDPKNPYNLTEADTEVTFRPPRSRRPSVEFEPFTPYEEIPDPADPELGCKHYKRNVKIQCFDCKRWYSCRHCHDESETSHALERRKTANMFCMLCKTPQAAGEFCLKCGHRAAWYYCNICKLWDDDNSKKIYHCPDCGICRRGEGIGKDFYHCKKCNMCIAIGSAVTHRCIERAAECDCPICGDYMFTSSASIVAMPCGHYLHKACYTRYMETAYKCPICKKSAVNMELQWRKLRHAIEAQPMPREFRDTKIVIQCNDCSAKSSVRYHWLGNQCSTCDSFNTNELQLLGPSPDESQVETAHAQVETQLTQPQPQTPQPQPTQEQQLRPRAQSHRSSGAILTTGTLPITTTRAGARVIRPYFVSVQDSTSDTSIRSSFAQNIPFSPIQMFNRMSRSLSPIRHYLIADSDDEAGAGAAGGYGDDVEFWGRDGRLLSGGEEDSDEEESEEESEEDDDDAGAADEEEDGAMAQRLDGQGRRELDDLDRLVGHF